MDRTPLRRAYVSATLSTLLALLLTEPSLAHVDIRPRLVEQGAATALRVELPRLRAGAAPVRLEVEGDGVTVLAADLDAVVRGETLWNVRVRVSRSVSGEVPLVLRALFADSESIEVDSSVVVVPPAEEGGGFPWAGVSIGATLALALALGILVVARRRT